LERKEQVMEHNTKNFDRKIEQMMNEHQVAPPFGAWNRISSELDAMPAAVAAGVAPVVTSLIPKRAMAGIIAAALVIGSSLITAYLINNSHNNNQANSAVANTTVASTVTTRPPTVQQTEPVKSTLAPAGIALTRVKVRHIAATNPVQSTIIAAQQVQPAINQPVALTPAPIINNENTDVPTPLEPVAQKAEDTQTYFFPPIDVSTPEKTTTPPKNTISNKAHTGDGTTASSNDDDKPVRKRFHPGRKHNFNYGNINRQ
jgi:hypothetical protein